MSASPIRPQLEPAVETRVVCPVCESDQASIVEPAEGWGEWYECGRCTLEFVEPLELTTSPEELYGAAYRGERSESNMTEFNERLRQRHALVHDDPTLWFWSPAFGRIIEWLKEHVGAGEAVFEIGCGLGFFMHAMRREGFDVVGLDVAEKAVELNRQDGFRVWHGQVASVPSGWVDPDAIVSMFMLHHLLDPIGFLSTIRERWPNASFAIAQYGPSNRDDVASHPPRTLTRWSARSLETALTRSGYRSTVEELAGTGHESRFVRPIRRVAKQSIRLPAVYRLFRRLEHRAVSPVIHRAGRSGYVLLAFAEPDA